MESHGGNFQFRDKDTLIYAHSLDKIFYSDTQIY
jgi:hypothetical protein